MTGLLLCAADGAIGDNIEMVFVSNPVGLPACSRGFCPKDDTPGKSHGLEVHPGGVPARLYERSGKCFEGLLRPLRGRCETMIDFRGLPRSTGATPGYKLTRHSACVPIDRFAQREKVA